MSISQGPPSSRPSLDALSFQPGHTGEPGHAGGQDLFTRTMADNTGGLPIPTAKTTAGEYITAPTVPKPQEATATGAPGSEVFNDLAKSIGMNPKDVAAVVNKLNQFYRDLTISVQELATVRPPTPNQNAIDTSQPIPIRPPEPNRNALDGPDVPKPDPRSNINSYDEPHRPQPGPNPENAPRTRAEKRRDLYPDPTRQPLPPYPQADR